MRVAYFADSLPPVVDGVSRTLAKLVETLESEGVEFRFFSAFDPGRSVSWSATVRRVPSVPFPPYPAYRIGLPQLHDVASELDRFGPDLVHVTSPTPLGLHGLDQARRRGIPGVASFHTDFVSYFRHYGLARLEGAGWALLRWFYDRAAVTYVPSRTTARQLAARGFRNLEIWGRGVDLGGFSPHFRDPELRARLGAGEAPIALFVGRLVREKDLDDLVAADALLRGRGVPFRLALVGEGPMRGELERRLPGAIFTGALGGEALARLYASADVFAFPSTTETFGNVVLEALASGLPVVAAARGGPVDLVVPGWNGFLVEPNSPPRLAEVLGILLRSPRLRTRLGAQAAASVGAMPWAAVNRRLLESYRRLAAGPPPVSPIHDLAA